MEFTSKSRIKVRLKLISLLNISRISPMFTIHLSKVMKMSVKSIRIGIKPISVILRKDKISRLFHKKGISAVRRIKINKT